VARKAREDKAKLTPEQAAIAKAKEQAYKQKR